MSNTKIEWANKVWNPAIGCTKVSRGCRNRYAEQYARRFMGIRNFSAGDRSIQHVLLKPERLDLPLRWRKPQRVFVNSMSDLFHEDVPEGFLADVLNVMVRTPQHTYQILTKRPQRMQELLTPWPSCYWHGSEALAGRLMSAHSASISTLAFSPPRLCTSGHPGVAAMCGMA